jgi:hypothetical protein
MANTQSQEWETLSSVKNKERITNPLQQNNIQQNNIQENNIQENNKITK